MTEDLKIRQISNLSILLNDDETQKLIVHLCKMPKKTLLSDMMSTDENGLITRFEPQNMSWGMVFFIQNIMILQRLRLIDKLAQKEGLIK